MHDSMRVSGAPLMVSVSMEFRVDGEEVTGVELSWEYGHGPGELATLIENALEKRLMSRKRTPWDTRRRREEKRSAGGQ